MLEFLEYGFMVRALLAGLIVAAVMPLLGVFLVAKRYSLIADGLAHVSLAGVGAGLVFGAAPVLVAIPFTIAGALFLEWLRSAKRVSGETSLAILLSGGLAVAVVLAGLAHGSRADFSSYLFGSITTTTQTDLTILGIAALLVAGFALGNYRVLLHTAFDEDSARIAGHRVQLYNYLLAAATALIVALSLRIVGGLLIGALLVIPVIAGSQLARSFRQTILFAVSIALLAVVFGLIASFYLGVAAGGAIVLTALLLLVLAFIFKRA